MTVCIWNLLNKNDFDDTDEFTVVCNSPKRLQQNVLDWMQQRLGLGMIFIWFRQTRFAAGAGHIVEHLAGGRGQR